MHIKMQLFLQPKLFHKGDIMYNIFRGNSQPCLAILQEVQVKNTRLLLELPNTQQKGKARPQDT